ncbi:hypothetical protein ACF0H5_003738 [Mactra antiquata]
MASKVPDQPQGGNHCCKGEKSSVIVCVCAVQEENFPPFSSSFDPIVETRGHLSPIIGLVIFVLGILLYLLLYSYTPNIQLIEKFRIQLIDPKQDEILSNKAILQSIDSKQDSKVRGSIHSEKTYLVLWHTVPNYLRHVSDALSANFSVCEYQNCKLTTDNRTVDISDAILWHRTLKTAPKFKRPVGQIWVYVDHESPAVVNLHYSKNWKPNIKFWYKKFNWTMTYNKVVADIHLPYGELKKHKTYIARDYDRIAASKTKGALVVTSHCKTDSKRLEYINVLKKYVEIDIMGKCGKKWNCGVKDIHDNCFDILNTSYSFYLAFENALCEQYHTEKLFENFKYDILVVTRGGLPHEVNTPLPEGSVIDSRNYKSAKELGMYLSHLQRNTNEYAKRLDEKSQFYSTNYRQTYQQALCDLCHRLNHQETYRKTIPNLLDVMSYKKSCRSIGLPIR